VFPASQLIHLRGGQLFNGVFNFSDAAHSWNLAPDGRERQDPKPPAEGSGCSNGFLLSALSFPYCRPTRNEADFVELIDGLVQAHPQAQRFNFVLDNLNPHQSESLVRYVAGDAAIAHKGVGA
jgi:hypothetical protein